MAQRLRTNRAGRTEQDRSRRELSQNFLRDPGAIAQIVRAAQPDRHDLIIEIGAGEGALTSALAGAAGRVVAYELDPALARRLALRFRDDDRVCCRYGDFLAARPPGEPFAVVGNIPFAITARIVDWCLTAPELRAATLVTQLEYARKRTGDYGRWSRQTVQTWPWFQWRLSGRIPREKFRPVPRVDSAILRLERRRCPLLPGAAMGAYRRFVELGFGGVGGSLHASLRRHHPARQVTAAFLTAHLDTRALVGHVRPEQWLALFHALQ